MIDQFFRRRYDKIGPQYPIKAATRTMLGANLVVFVGVVLLNVQFDFTTRQFIFVTVLSQVLIILDNLVSIYFLRRSLRPVEAVLSGSSTDADSALRAWGVLVALPSRHFVKGTARTTVIVLVPLAVSVAVMLSVPWWGVPVMLVVGAVFMVYGHLLRFLILELAFRPEIRALWNELPDAIDAHVRVISVRDKLLLGLPMINVITGAVVAVLSRDGAQSGIENLSSDVVLVLFVTTTVSLGLSLLFSRSLLSPIAHMEKAAEKARSGDFSVRVPVMTADEIGGLSSGFNLLMAGMQERGRLEQALGDYVDPTVAAAVVQADEQRLDGSEVDLTVMFMDIRGFTAFAEGAAPQDVVARLSEFFEIVIPTISAHGGQANKFLGDGLLALFGAPEPLQGHADHAVDAALEVVAKVRTRFAGQVNLAIGIHSGPAVAGRVGGGGKFDFTVVGDTVNTAQRVERATRETDDAILISGATHSRLIRDHGGFDERPEVEMSGKQQRVRLWTPRALEAVSGLVSGDLGAVAAAAPDGLAIDLDAARQRRRR